MRLAVLKRRETQYQDLLEGKVLQQSFLIHV